MPAVINRGNKLGTNATTIILKERNIKAIKRAVINTDNSKDCNKLSSKYFVPF